MTSTRTAIPRPAKRDVFGVLVTPTNYDQTVRWCIERARHGEGGCVDLMAVHSLITAARDHDYRRKINAFDIVAPDGQPVRWALNRFHNAGLTDRVYGPEFTLRLCRAAAEQGVSIYLYGATPAVIAKLTENLLNRFPALRIVGSESPPFRPLTPDEDRAAIERINSSGAGLLFIGIGCPKQELFAYEHRDSIRAVQLCVGAAFDFHAGLKQMAPVWMQKRGLEWLFRLSTEPKRLWKRYFVTNTIFLYYAAKRMVFGPGTTSAEVDEVIPGHA